MVAGSPEEGRQMVREAAALGWKVVKTYSLLSRDTYLAIADEARQLGLLVVGHVPESVRLRDAVAAGQIEVSHISRVTQACTTREEAMVAANGEALASDDPLGNLLTVMAGHVMTTLESWDEERCREVARMLAEAGVAITPTLMVSDFYVGADPSPDDPRMATVPAAVREQWAQADFRRQQMTEEMLDAAPGAIAQDWRTVKIMHEAGVTILAGTDAAFLNPYIFHGATLHGELGRLVALGLTPLEALASATVLPARFFDGEDGGRGIAPGGRADLVLLGANPLDDIANTRAIVATLASGRLYDRKALDALKQKLVEHARRDYER
jgi:imidazolonepropionase-like amidohydrolase